MYGRKYKNFKKGSFLVLALIVLSVVLMMTLAVMLGASVSRENASTIGKSSQSFQSSDSGLEAFNQIFMNNKYSTVLNTTNFPGYACVNSAAQITGTSNSGDTYTIKPYDKQATPAPLACGSTIGQIGSAKVLSIHGGTVRAISAGAPASGFYPDGDYSLVSWWPFSSDLTDAKHLSDAAKAKIGSGQDILIKSNYNGTKPALVFNDGITPSTTSNNFAIIPHNDAYKTQEGTWSFWYYSENVTYSQTKITVPFSKDQEGCYSDYPTFPNNYTQTCSSSSTGVGATCYTTCSSGLSSPKDNTSKCDCGQVSIYLRYDTNGTVTTNPTGYYSSAGFISTAFINDGSWGGYRLNVKPDSGVLGQWHLLTITYNGNGYYLYTDGKFITRVSQTEKSSVTRNSGDTSTTDSGYVDDDGREGMMGNYFDLWLGKERVSADQYWFKGGIRDLRFYNRALEPDEVKRLYTETK